MPALFAYLIALGLLFGAGYGALNWLAEPPVKVAAKAKSKSKLQPSYQQAPSSDQALSPEIAEASPPASKSDQGSVTPTANDHDAASASKDQKIPSQAQPSLATPSPATDEPAMQPIIASPAAPAALDKPSKRSHSRQAGSHVEKRKLVAITLRTIEFPDGRRITQLIPLGSGESLPR